MTGSHTTGAVSEVSNVLDAPPSHIPQSDDTPIDMVSIDAGYRILLELPGVQAENIRLSVNAYSVSVTDVATTASVVRDFVLPTDCDVATLKADMQNGLLTLVVDRREPIGRKVAPLTLRDVV